ncbi:MAG: hypothetical protein ACJ735_15160 [Actinomycetes bacterium]
MELTKDQVRHAAYDIALYVAVETVLAKVAHRLRYGRPCAECGGTGGRHRPVRRLAGAVVHQLGAASATGMYLRRQRVRAAVDRMIVGLEEKVPARHARIPNARIPRQRRAQEDLYTALDRAPTPSGK